MTLLKTLLVTALLSAMCAVALVVGLSMPEQHATSVSSARRVPATGATGDPTGPTTRPTPSAQPTRGSEPTATPTDEPTAHPTHHPTHHQAPAPDVMTAGDHGTPVRELQQRLFQLAWFPETTTGSYDAATTTAVKGFQSKRGLPATGRLDAQTWHRLVAMTQQPSHDAMFNVLHPGHTLYGAGAHGSDVRALQARLKAIAWYFGDVTGDYDAQTVTAVKGFQAKRQIPVTGDVDRRTLDRLEGMTTTPTHDALYNLEPSPGALDARCRTGRVLCIDKSSRTLRWVVDGHVVQTLDARFGSTLNDTPTREGVFHVFLMDADHVSKLFGSAMPFSMFFSGGQAVHYSSDFAATGYYGASHGCVNIRDYEGIKWLFSQVHVGDKVVVYWS